MTLTNYWWLLIWMFAAGGIIAWALPKQPVMVMGKREYRWTMSSAVIFVLPYIIWAGYRKGFGDTLLFAIVMITLSRIIWRLLSKQQNQIQVAAIFGAVFKQ